MSKNRKQRQSGKSSMPAHARLQQSGPSKKVLWIKSSFGKRVLSVAFVVSVGVLLLFLFLRPDTTSELTKRAQADYESKQYGEVIHSVLQLRDENQANPSVLMMGAESAVALQRFDLAIEFLEAVKDDDEYAVRARVRSAEIYFQTGLGAQSEQQYLRALELDPDHVVANYGYSILLNTFGRRYEASPFALQAMKGGVLEFHQLALFSDRRPSFDVGKDIEPFFENSGGDPRYNLGRARKLVINGKYSTAIPFLEAIVRDDPDNAEASVFLGESYLAIEDSAKFSDWYLNANESVKSHPDFWLVSGDWAFDNSQPQSAAYSYWRTLNLDPDTRRANYRLARLLQSTPFSEEVPDGLVDQLLLRDKHVRVLVNELSQLPFDPNELTAEEHVPVLQRIVIVLGRLGRTREEREWLGILMALDPQNQWATDRYKADVLQTSLPHDRYANGTLPCQSIDLSHLEMPRIESESAIVYTPGDANNRILFTDATDQAGIEFEFHNGTTGKKDRALYMYQEMGGSVAVLDLNLDGLPDIYFPQGSDWPVDANQDKYLDKLFLNRGNGTFLDVTQSAAIRQNGFGQSVTIGDFDSDGFSDIYIGNIGENRLLRNNGDGTFTDISREAGIRGDDWTCGVAMVDLDGDSHPDMYDLNYLGGTNVFSRTCKSLTGAEMSCGPSRFEPTQDQILINDQSGKFVDLTGRLDLSPGKGLGIVAADINADDKLDLFIGNDGEPNFLLLNQSDMNGLAFSETASAYGLDRDDAGQPQATMGIAVLDLNKDQRLDFFVTNFVKEPNTFYQSDDFGFTDVSRKTGVANTGLPYVGFGTQAIDAELDGDQDLLIVNGHVDDYGEDDFPFQMPSQILENDGNGRFVELNPEQAGEFFARPIVGRGMARLDWNRDGLEEIVIGNLTGPAILLENKSRPAAGFISLRLIGTESNRDAIGTSVVVNQAGTETYRQLTAGDGYGSSNQRELVFAVADARNDDDSVDSIHIHWLSGREQTFTGVAANHHYIAIEGDDELHLSN